MSENISGDSAEKGFAVGHGLLAAAETLNSSMGEASSSPPMSGMAGGPGGGQADHEAQIPRPVGSHLTNTLKLFASLGLSPSDLDVLAKMPPEKVSVESLPDLLMQLKNRKVEANRHMPSDPADGPYHGNMDNWGDVHGGKLNTSMSQTSSRGSRHDFGYRSVQDPSRSYSPTDYDDRGSGLNRGRWFSDLDRDTYHGLDVGRSSSADSMFMQRRMGSPSQGKVQDYFGVIPRMFPHVCSLCDFDVHSAMEWTQHTNGLRHSENRRRLLQMYTDWSPQMSSIRSTELHCLGSENRLGGLLGHSPQDMGMQRGGMSSSWGSSPGFSRRSQPFSRPGKFRSRVVVLKYERKPLSSNGLWALAKPFGTVCESLVLKKKAFLEMSSHEEAQAMADYYQRKTARVHGKEVHVYLSQDLLVIEKEPLKDNRRAAKDGPSQVVFLSNLPRDADISKDLLAAAEKFGIVEKHLFFKKEAFVQMQSPEDAEMLVKYYTLNPLTINSRTIRLNICTKYKTLVVNPLRSGADASGRDSRSSKTDSRRHRSSSATGPIEKPEVPSEDDVESGDVVVGVVESDENEEDVKEEEMAPSADVEQPEPEDRTAKDGCDETVAEKEGGGGGGGEARDDYPKAKEGGDDAEKMVQPDLSESTEAAKYEETEHAPQAEGDECPEEAADKQSVQSGEPGPSENLDEFVTLDELEQEEVSDQPDSGDGAQVKGSEKTVGMRVVRIIGYKRGPGYLDQMMSLAKPFGTVVRHLILYVRPEAFLELSSEEEAKAMVSFYNRNVIPSICGKPVKIYHSQTYATIQVRLYPHPTLSLTKDCELKVVFLPPQSRKVLYVSRYPEHASDADILKIAAPFGEVKRYLMNRSRNECFIEMERGDDAREMAEAYNANPPKLHGKQLTVYVAAKYKELRHGIRPPTPEPEEQRAAKRDRAEMDGSTMMDEDPLPKKTKEESSAEQQEVVEAAQDKPAEIQQIKCDETEIISAAAAAAEKPAESKDSASNQDAVKPETTSLGPYEADVSVGTEFVKIGYFCKLCFLFYSNEHSAKVLHCRGKAHYENLKKYLDQKKTKEDPNSGSK
ncbi:matrin-3-like isoform X2 [Denticeps clupeoides]|uniref:matrin-3-like isoform X2 n=1 Tax=Denticeps clupeoides TaxID=299321 RepID=UPI0010A2C0F1|nr:matrin-3-like isoform X2 [Denticeps clupeoides]